jgi:hypothetical protein
MFEERGPEVVILLGEGKVAVREVVDQLPRRRLFRRPLGHIVKHRIQRACVDMQDEIIERTEQVIQRAHRIADLGRHAAGAQLLEAFFGDHGAAGIDRHAGQLFARMFRPSCHGFSPSQ